MSDAQTTPGAPNWRNRIIGSGMMAPQDFLANPGNFRIHSALQEEALEEVLDTVGWVRTVLVNQTTGHVLDGHLRVALGIRRNEPQIPYDLVELTEAEEKLVLAALDPIAGMAGTDAEKLRELLDGMQLHEDGSLKAMLDEMVKSAPVAGDWQAALGGVGSAEAPRMQQMTFVLTNEQAEQVKAAIQRAKDIGAFGDTGNDNSNGNALARMAEMFQPDTETT